MARNRKNLAAAVRFGPALKALLVCLLIAGSAVGYVWQKGQIYQLHKQFRETESRWTQLQAANQRLADKLADQRSIKMLAVRADRLGLFSVQPRQLVLLPEPTVVPPENKTFVRQLAARPGGAPTPEP